MGCICANCGRTHAEFLKTAYGDYLCENCWDDYLMTDKGKIEYLEGIVRGDYPMDCFDADFLGHVATCWRRYIYEINLSDDDELAEIETKATALGLL